MSRLTPLYDQFLGVFEKLRESSSCPSVRMERLECQCIDFHENFYLSISPKSVKKIHFSLKSNKNDGKFAWIPFYIYILLYLYLFFIGWEIFQTKLVEKIKIHILCPISCLRKPCLLWDSVEKYCTAGQATYDNTRIIWLMRTAGWIPKAKRKLWDYVMFIAFLLEKCLHERASVFRYSKSLVSLLKSIQQ
jgi:hypothetical protein